MLEKVKLRYSKKPVKGDIYNLRGLKCLLDDALLDYMTKVKKLKKGNLYTDFQIAVGLVSTALASLLAYLSMHYEFAEYRHHLIWILSVYFLINGIVYICDMFITTTYNFTTSKNTNSKEQDRDKKEEYKISTLVSSPNPIYTLLLYKNNKLIPEKWSKSVFNLFDEKGTLNAELFLNEVDTFFNKL